MRGPERRTSSHISAEQAREGRVIEEADRQEAEDERPRRAPEPEILVQRVQNGDQAGGGERAHVRRTCRTRRRYYDLPAARVSPGRRAALYFTSCPDHPRPWAHMNADLDSGARRRESLDVHVREIVAWHFDPATGCPFWLEFAQKLGWDPRREITGVRRPRSASVCSRTTGCAAARCSAGCPRDCAGKPVYVFETGGTTGIPKTRVAFDDFRIDYEMFSDTLPDEYFPKGSNWLMLGPSGPRRLRLAVEHLAQHRGGICFCVDLDPRWVIKLIKKGWSEHLEAYKEHVIDQAVTILQAGHDIKCMFTTPKLLEALALRLDRWGTTIRKAGITGIFSRRHRVHAAVEPLRARGTARRRLHGADLRQHADGPGGERPERTATTTTRSPTTPRSRARSIEVVDFDDPTRVVEYGQTGRVKLTTLTKEFFMPGFLERDEGEREAPCEGYPWDGISGVRPFRGVAQTTTVGVYYD